MTIIIGKTKLNLNLNHTVRAVGDREDGAVSRRAKCRNQR